MKIKFVGLIILIIVIAIFNITSTEVFAEGEDGYVLHKVASGENLTSIARQYGVTVQELIELNDISTPSLIVTGHILKISVIEEASTEEEAPTEEEKTEPPAVVEKEAEEP